MTKIKFSKFSDMKIRIKKLSEFINEMNEKAIKAGVVELDGLDVKKSIQLFTKSDVDILTIVPNYESNFKILKEKFSEGHFERKSMPRLSKDDVKILQKKLVNGDFEKKDIEDKKLINLDTDIDNNIVNVSELDIKPQDIEPLQYQLYFDQVITFFTNYKSLKDIWDTLKSRPILISQDNQILDGHHRYAASILIDSNQLVPVIKVNLSTKKLMKLANKFSVELGNEKNE